MLLSAQSINRLWWQSQLCPRTSEQEESSHLLLQASHSCVIDGYNELVFILHIRIVLTLRDMDSEGCLYPSSRDNLSTDLGCILRISFIS